MVHYLHRKLLRGFSLWNIITISHHIQSFTLQCCIPLQFEINVSGQSPTSSTNFVAKWEAMLNWEHIENTPDRPTIARITRELKDWEGWVLRWVVNYPLGPVRDLLDTENLKHGPMGWCPHHEVGLGSNRRKRFKQMQRQGKIKILKLYIYTYISIEAAPFSITCISTVVQRHAFIIFSISDHLFHFH